VRRDIAPSREKGQTTAGNAQASVDSNGLQRTVGTLCADTHPGSYSGQDAYTGRLIPMVYENHPADSRVKEMGDTCTTVTSRWGTGGGNVPLVQQAFDSYNLNLSEINQTIKSPQGGVLESVGGVIQQAFRKGRRAQSKDDFETWVDDGKANTLNTFDLGDVRTTHAIALAENTIGRQPQNGGNGNGFTENGPMYTLNATGVHGIAHAVSFSPSHFTRGFDMTPTDELSGTIKAEMNDNSPHVAVGAIQANMAVRRLTPIECERLQGFPDNYTNIKANCPDGSRYKALGNSWAVPVVAWIGKRINDAIA
jgi:DNA (cytosine-5)-methyltransferase 1